MTPPALRVVLARTPAEVQLGYDVRRSVFVDEQGVPAELELDDLDPGADHFLGYLGEDVVGAGRLVVEPPGFEGAPERADPVGHLGRLAVLAPARGSGLGVTLVRAIEARAADRGLPLMALSAQTYATGFYARLGYEAHGPEFDDAGLPHVWMTKPLR